MERTYTLLGWGRDYNPQNWFYNPAYIVNRLYYILGGTVEYKKSLPLKPGRLYLFRGDPEFAVSQSEEDPVDHIFFDFLTDRPLLDTDYLEVDPEECAGLGHLICTLLEEKISPEITPEKETGKLYLGLFLHILENRLLHEVQYSEITTSVLKLFHDRELKELSVSGIAKELSLNEDYIIRCFKKEMGITPHRYLAIMKKEQAISYLRQRMSCTEIAERLGFESVSSFSYFFKHETGIGPGKIFK